MQRFPSFRRKYILTSLTCDLFWTGTALKSFAEQTYSQLSRISLLGTYTFHEAWTGTEPQRSDPDSMIPPSPRAELHGAKYRTSKVQEECTFCATTSDISVIPFTVRSSEHNASYLSLTRVPTLLTVFVVQDSHHTTSDPVLP